MEKVRIVFEDSQTSSITLRQRFRDAVGKVKARWGSKWFRIFVILSFFAMLSAVGFLLGSLPLNKITAPPTKVKTTQPTERTTSSFTKSTSFSSTTTFTTKTTKPLPVIHCACAADLHNLNNDTYLLKKEKYLVVDIVEKVFNNVGNSTAGLWVYGFVENTAAKVFSKVFDEMKNDYMAFYMDVANKMDFGPHLLPYDQNLTDVINNGADPLRVANCLLLLSAMKEMSDSWRIEPRYDYKRIVIVSLQGGNFTNHVDSRGIVVNVPFDFTSSDIEAVYQAIVGGFM